MQLPRPSPRRIAGGLPAALIVLAFAGPAAAQDFELTRRSYDDTENGYRLRYPAKWEPVPVVDQLKDIGIVYRCEPPAHTKPEGGVLFVFRLNPMPAKAGDQATTAEARPDIGGQIDSVITIKGFDKAHPDEDEEVEVSSLRARHKLWQADEVVVDAWTYRLPEYDLALVYLIGSGDKNAKRWLQLYEKSAKSFETIAVSGDSALSEGASYEEQLGFHRRDAQRTPGWDAQPTPSKKFIIKTSSRDQDFLDQLIERLEKSREIFERDFPPEKPIEHVSVVRVCSTEEEFHRYGGTAGGVAGWFNPGSTELVIYDAKDIDRNMTFAVLSHEGFHQYCYFLFDRSEAHRWFDEGHGDYYGGIRFKYGKAEITPKMPAGLDRLSVIKELVRTGTFARLSEHLNYDHQQWQTQGPSNVSCYAQSWSIIYMLRQGTLGKVPKKLWRPEYADIIPNYVRTLADGFQKAYAEAEAEEASGEGAEGEEEHSEPTTAASVLEQDGRPNVKESRKKEIWSAAMAASFGRVDLEEFEKNWIQYVSKEL
jgi:hypothetical protein